MEAHKRISKLTRKRFTFGPLAASSASPQVTFFVILLWIQFARHSHPFLLRKVLLPFIVSYWLPCWAWSRKEAMAGPQSHESLEYTPTWVVAAVCTIFVVISLLVERFLHYLGKVRSLLTPFLPFWLLALEEKLHLLFKLCTFIVKVSLFKPILWFVHSIKKWNSLSQEKKNKSFFFWWQFSIQPLEMVGFCKVSEKVGMLVLEMIRFLMWL